MDDEKLIIYDTETRDILITKIGDTWVLPVHWTIYSGTKENIKQHIGYTDEGDAFFIPDDFIN